MSIRRSIGIAVVLFAVGAVTPLAFADDPPPGGPAISQYVETVPSGTGGRAVGVGRSRSTPLPKKAEKKLGQRTTPLAPKLRSIATSSSYGAPQQTLPRSAKPARASRPRTTAKPGKVPRSQAPRPRPLARDDAAATQTDRTALSAAVSAATGGGDRAPVILLAAIVLITTAAALAAAARRTRRGR
jgi:hypothetical protein